MLSTLPYELLYKILLSLNNNNIYNIILTCKSFHKTNFHSHLLPLYITNQLFALDNTNDIKEEMLEYIKNGYSFLNYLKDLVNILELTNYYYRFPKVSPIKYTKQRVCKFSYNNITLKKKTIKTVYVHSIYRISRPSYIYLNKHHKTVLALIY